MAQTVLIIGITGGIGLAFAKACQKKGWQIRALHRNPAAAKRRLSALPDIDWISGDGMARQDVLKAAEGVDVIFHAANPPGYAKWRELALPMLENAIAAALAGNARLAFPGNVYNFGPDARPLVNETSPQHPTTRKGQVRVEMEGLLKAAAKKGAKILIVRAGDFFGADAPSSWFHQIMAKPGKKVVSTVYPGRHEAGHSWAYLPDLAETFVQLLERESDLASFDVFHFGGQYFPRGGEMAVKILEVAGVPDGKIGKAPWLVIRLLSPFVTLFREMIEMRYLWQEDLRLDNGKLVAFLGREPHTPVEQALRDSLTEMKCL